VELSPEIRILLSESDFLSRPTGNGKVATREFDGQTAFVRLSMRRGSARVFRVGLGADISSNGGYGLDLSSTKSAEMIAVLNHKLAELNAAVA
jgi:hypothetical protein